MVCQINCDRIEVVKSVWKGDMSMQSKVIKIGEKAIDIKEPMINPVRWQRNATIAGCFRHPSFCGAPGMVRTGRRWPDFVWRPGIPYILCRYACPENLQSIGHTTMIFNNWDDERLETSIYLTPYVLPAITDGTTITYKKKDWRWVPWKELRVEERNPGIGCRGSKDGFWTTNSWLSC